MGRLQELRDAGETVYSFSRLGAFKQCQKSYEFSYILKAPKERRSLYAEFGSAVHDAVEKIQRGEIGHEQAVEEFLNKIKKLQDMGIGIPFGDIEENKASAVHFILNFKKVERARAEVEILYQLDSNWFVGYVDLLEVEKEEDGIFYMKVIDYKTSKVYAGEKKAHNALQLIFYAYVLEQLHPNIRITTTAWNHVLIANVSFAGGRSARRSRSSIYIHYVDKMKAYSDKHELGYTAEELLELASINECPEELKELFVITDCIVEVKYDEKEIERLKAYINFTLRNIQLVQEYACRKDEVFCTALCEYYHCCPAYNPTPERQTDKVFEGIDLDALF